jgi:AcrR family transcriptional regulator
MEIRQVQAGLPRGRGALPREQVIYIQRMRILDALVDLMAERGYGESSVAEVSARSGVSRTTFYRIFSTKREAYLAACTHQRGTGPAWLAWSLPYQSQRCLRYIEEHPGACSQAVRAGLGFRHLSQVSRILSRLERLGLARTRRAPGKPHAWRATLLGGEVLRALDLAAGEHSAAPRSMDEPRVAEVR